MLRKKDKFRNCLAIFFFCLIQKLVKLDSLSSFSHDLDYISLPIILSFLSFCLSVFLLMSNCLSLFPTCAYLSSYFLTLSPKFSHQKIFVNFFVTSLAPEDSDRGLCEVNRRFSPTTFSNKNLKNKSDSSN